MCNRRMLLLQLAALSLGCCVAFASPSPAVTFEPARDPWDVTQALAGSALGTVAFTDATVGTLAYVRASQQLFMVAVNPSYVSVGFFGERWLATPDAQADFDR